MKFFVRFSQLPANWTFELKFFRFLSGWEGKWDWFRFSIWLYNCYCPHDWNTIKNSFLKNVNCSVQNQHFAPKTFLRLLDLKQFRNSSILWFDKNHFCRDHLPANFPLNGFQLNKSLYALNNSTQEGKFECDYYTLTLR